MLERDIIWCTRYFGCNMGQGNDGWSVDGRKDGREERENQTAKDNTNSQSGSTPRRLPRSDRPTPDLVSESSSRTVTCMSPTHCGKEYD